MLCALWVAGCKVYDESLVHDLTARSAITPIDASVVIKQPEGNRASADDWDGGLPPDAASCGNGRVDPGEACDIAIARGERGACPQGCSGNDGCMRRVLLGSDCGAHCALERIGQAIADDGCCPDGVDAGADDDCAAVCGDGVISGAEHCDPPSSCPSAADCVSHDACLVAHYSGDPNQCTAMCELRPQRTCKDGDGCCPSGCNGLDADCPHDTSAALPGQPPGTPPAQNAPCIGECNAASGGSCSALHGNSACASCDCTWCPAETMSCYGLTDDTARAQCAAVVECAAMNNCTMLSCYCGVLSARECALLPIQPGPCVNEIRAAAGSSDFGTIQAALLGSGPLALASNLLDCRSQHCTALSCGL